MIGMAATVVAGLLCRCHRWVAFSCFNVSRRRAPASTELDSSSLLRLHCMSAAIVAAYIVGGLTFIPLLLVATYICRTVFTFCNSLSARSALHKVYEHEPPSITTTTLATTPVQTYKLGWVRVSRDEQKQLPLDVTIGDLVKTYIAGRNGSQQQRRDIFFAVLKHTTLFLYDSEKQLDCKAVIQVHQHRVTIHPPGLEEFELFARPSSIRLQHVDNKQQQQSYFITCSRCIDKEDWYHALKRASHKETRHHEIHFDQVAMNQLINTIHSDDSHFQTQWFNAVLGRIFCAVYKTHNMNAFLYKKLLSKLDKINSRRPPFLDEISVRSVHPGHALPVLTNPKLVSLGPTGELTAEANIHYAGAIRFEVETVLKWKYSDRLKPLTVDLVLAITLKDLKGRFVTKIKEPPTNRFWYGFQELPQMEWLVEPLVWERRVGYSVVVKAIQSKIEELIAENVVLPNMDDITFFPTGGAGGIYETSADRDTTMSTSTTSLTPATMPATAAAESETKSDNDRGESPMHHPQSISLATAKRQAGKPGIKDKAASASMPDLGPLPNPSSSPQPQTTRNNKPRKKSWFSSNNTKKKNKSPSMVTSKSDTTHSSSSSSSSSSSASGGNAPTKQQSFAALATTILNRQPPLQQQEKKSAASISSPSSEPSPPLPSLTMQSQAKPKHVEQQQILSSSPGSITSSSSTESSCSTTHINVDATTTTATSNTLMIPVSTKASIPASSPPAPSIVYHASSSSDSSAAAAAATTTSSDASLLATSVSSHLSVSTMESHDRGLRLRKQVSLGRLNPKSVASTAVSQINVSHAINNNSADVPSQESTINHVAT